MAANPPGSAEKDTGGGSVVVLAVLLVIAYFGVKGKQPESDQRKPDGKIAAAELLPRTPPNSFHVPHIGIGGTYRNIRWGASLDPDMKVGIDVGYGKGVLGVGITVITFSLKDGSIAFIPDDPEIGLELGEFRAAKWSRSKGFGSELGTKFSGMQGHLVFDFKADTTKSPLLSPSTAGTLTFKDDVWTFTPANSLAKLPSSLETFDLIKRETPAVPNLVVPPPHVMSVGQSGFYLPEQGYTWLDGTTDLRIGLLQVKWSPGQASLIPAHVHASATEGEWEPDAGYQWEDGTQNPMTTIAVFLKTARWTPGLPSPAHPNVVASIQEGMWSPAPGYTWTTDETSNLEVRPVE